jgi:hypothetical protein
VEFWDEGHLHHQRCAGFELPFYYKKEQLHAGTAQLPRPCLIPDPERIEQALFEIIFAEEGKR